MRGIGLATSPTWYCSRICDCNSKGLLAFAGRNNVIFLDINSVPPVFCGWICESRNRVSSVAWNPQEGTKLGCSGDEDGKVHVWNFETQTLVAEHQYHAQVGILRIV